MHPQNTPLTSIEQKEIERANAAGLPPVVFVHGLWMMSGGWAQWRELFESNGYTTLAPGWPGDPETVDEARKHPERLANKGMGAITEHYVDAIGKLKIKPAIVGHSIGGVITQKLAGMGLAVASVAVDPAIQRGVWPLPFSTIRSALPVLINPFNISRAMMLTYKQFRYAFANAVDEKEAKELYERYPVPGSARALFQAALANVNFATEARADNRNPARGPLKIISGQRDHIVPWSITNSTFKRQKKNVAVTEIQEIANRGHSLCIDSGWKEVAQVALEFIERNGSKAQSRAA